MAPSNPVLQDLPLEVLTHIFQHLDLADFVRVSQSCERFRHGGPETVELPTESPFVAVLRRHAFPRLKLVPRTRPMGCSESWVTYLARCARQHRCREAPPIAAGNHHSLFLDAAGRVLACGKGAGVGHGDARRIYFDPSPVAALAAVRVRSVAAGLEHSLALSWDSRVCSWGWNGRGQPGHGDALDRLAPAPVEGLEGVRGIAACHAHSLAVTESGAVFRWGQAFLLEAGNELLPIIVEGFGGVRVRRVFVKSHIAFAIGEDGALYSWGADFGGLLGHGDTQYQPSAKRVEALRGICVSSVAVGGCYVLALAEDGLVYAWGETAYRAVLGNPHVERELLPKPVEALRGVRVGSVDVAGDRSYAVAETGEVWAWGLDSEHRTALGHGEQEDCRVPNPIETLRGVKVNAVAAAGWHTLALADDRSVYAWGNKDTAVGAMGRVPSISGAPQDLRTTPRRIPALRVACAP
jgi:alpha-tubulin suppressor-like RCC1 family protein